MQMLGRIPKNGDKIDFHNLVFEVKEIKALKPELLQVTKKNNSISFSTNENKS